RGNRRSAVPFPVEIPGMVCGLWIWYILMENLPGLYTRRHRSLSPPRHLGDPEAQGEAHICLQEADLTLPLHRDQKSLPLQDTPEEGMIPETEGMLLLPGEVLTVWRIWAL